MADEKMLFVNTIRKNIEKIPTENKETWIPVGMDGIEGTKIIDDEIVSSDMTWSSLKTSTLLNEKAETKDVAFSGVIDETPTDVQKITVEGNKKLTFRGFGFVNDFNLQTAINATDTTTKSVTVAEVMTGNNTVKRKFSFTGFGKIKSVTLEGSVVMNSSLTTPLTAPTFTATKNESNPQSPVISLTLNGLEAGDRAGSHYVSNADQLLYWVKLANDNSGNNYGEIILTKDIEITMSSLQTAVGNNPIGYNGNISIRGLNRGDVMTGTGAGYMQQLTISGTVSSSMTRWRVFGRTNLSNIRIVSTLDWRNAGYTKGYSVIVDSCTCRNVTVHEKGLWKAYNSSSNTGGQNAFMYCSGMIGCKVIVDKYSITETTSTNVGRYFGFRNCDNLFCCSFTCVSCRNTAATSLTSAYSFYGFSDCVGLFGCLANLTNCGAGYQYRSGFYNCKNIVMCKADVSVSTTVSGVYNRAYRYCYGAIYNIGKAPTETNTFSLCYANRSESIKADATYSGGYNVLSDS